MSEPLLTEFLPPFWREKGSAKEWAVKIMPYRAKLGVTKAEGDPDALATLVADLQNSFVDTVSSHEHYGAHFFITHKLEYPNMPPIMTALPKDLTIAFNSSGMFVFDSSSFLKMGAVKGEALHMFG